eukprot:IDg11505t1
MYRRRDIGVFRRSLTLLRRMNVSIQICKTAIVLFYHPMEADTTTVAHSVQIPAGSYSVLFYHHPSNSFVLEAVILNENAMEARVEGTSARRRSCAMSDDLVISEEDIVSKSVVSVLRSVGCIRRYLLRHRFSCILVISTAFATLTMRGALATTSVWRLVMRVTRCLCRE